MGVYKEQVGGFCPRCGSREVVSDLVHLQARCNGCGAILAPSGVLLGGGWDEQRDGGVRDGRVNQYREHAVDAMRYAAASIDFGPRIPWWKTWARAIGTYFRRLGFALIGRDVPKVRKLYFWERGR